MTWKLNDRLQEHDFRHIDQRSAFRAGYSDGYHDADMWAGNNRNWHPDEYRAGFDAGISDRTPNNSLPTLETQTEFDTSTITAAALKLRAEYLASGHYQNLLEINQGGCENFACDLHELIGKPTENEKYAIVDPAFFMQEAIAGEDENSGYPMDRDHLAAHWPSVVPPAGLDWDDLDHISGFANFTPGTHIWVFSDGKHYDAEAPEGVSTPFDLPFFQRIIQRWIDNGRPAAVPLPAPGM
jgi:hypothetical protein